MKILVLGGTRFMGVHMVRRLIADGHSVTVGTRGQTPDPFGDAVERVRLDRSDGDSLRAALGGRRFDAVCDNIAFCSDDIYNLLETVQTDRYVLTSTASVYETLVVRTPERDFDPLAYPLCRCGRGVEYGEGKRQAECALFQSFPDLSAVAVRFPFIVGADDYTKRLEFYIDRVARGAAIFVDNMDSDIGFVHSVDAGHFLAWLATSALTGPVNGASEPGIAVRDLLRRAEILTGKSALLRPDGEPAPFNGDPPFSLSNTKAAEAGFPFPATEEWMDDVLRIYAGRV